MAGARVTTGHRPRILGTQVGMGVNVFSLQPLRDIVSGDMLAPILLDAMEPAVQDAKDAWPVLTGASQDSIEAAVTEVGSYFARASLRAGGEKLISDPRNKSGKDYAPFIEFNGSPLGRGRGALLNALIVNDPNIRRRVHDAVDALIKSV